MFDGEEFEERTFPYLVSRFELGLLKSGLLYSVPMSESIGFSSLYIDGNLAFIWIKLPEFLGF